MERYKIDTSARVRLPLALCADLQIAQGDYIKFEKNERGEWVIKPAYKQ